MMISKKEQLTLQSFNQELFSNVRRSINALKDKEVIARKNALKELMHITKNQQLPALLFEEITYMGLKQIIRCYYDHSENNRENAILLTIQLLSRCKNISLILPYILEALKDRTNCVDLQGIDNLPQKLRPHPGQKPKVMLKVTQQCEEVRILYCQLIKRIIFLLDKDAKQMVRHLDDMVNIQRALIMDPAPDIQKIACETLQIFCNDYSDILLHFTQSMARAVLLPLISKKSKIRIAALNALTATLWCGLWKYNAFVFENLIGFKDPNSVPIKDFYQPTNNINYLATFIIDSNVKVRQQFMKHIKIWVCDLNDKYDHHGKIVPYILSGLSDADQTVRNTAFQTIVEIGKQIEEEKQKDFRQNKQFAIDAAWTWDGKLVDLPVEEPFKTRPSLGSRFFIRGHVRKFWTALYKQVRDIHDANRIRAAQLAVYGAIFTQNYLTQFLDIMIPQLLPSILPVTQDDQKVSEKVAKIFYYIGRYCQQSGYIHLIQAALDGKLIQNSQFVRCAMKGLSMMIKGNLEAVPEDESLCHKKDNIIQLLRVIQQCKIAGDVYNFNCIEAHDIAISIFQGLQKQANEEQRQQILQQHFLNLLKLLAVSQYQRLYSNGFSMKKSDIVNQNQSAVFADFINILDRFLPLYTDALDQLQQYLENIFCDPPSLMDSDWKIIIILYRYCCSKGKQNQRLNQIFLLTQEAICQCLIQNKSTEILVFTTKFIYNLILTNQNNENNLLPQSTKLLIACTQNLAKFKPMKKLPVYDQHLVQEDPDSKILKTSQQNYIMIYKYCSKALLLYSINKINLSKVDSAGLIYFYCLAFKRVEKHMQCVAESVKTIWGIFEKIPELNQSIPNQLVWVHQKQKIAVFPIVVDFCVDRLQQYLQPVLNTMVFTILQKISVCWPKMINMTQKIPNVYPNFLDLLEKLFKYALNEKDIETKKKYMYLLSKLAKKMPSWFKTEARMAQEGKRWEKHRLIQQVMKDANI